MTLCNPARVGAPWRPPGLRPLMAALAALLLVLPGAAHAISLSDLLRLPLEELLHLDISATPSAKVPGLGTSSALPAFFGRKPA